MAEAITLQDRTHSKKSSLFSRLRIDEKSDGAIVHESDIHHRAESSRGDGFVSEFAKPFNHRLVD